MKLHDSKPGTWLFTRVNSTTYRKTFKTLERMRLAFPAYRDDELLMAMMCHAIHGTSPFNTTKGN